MKYKIAITLACSLIFNGCAISQHRSREARLMPPEIAKEIIAKYTSDSWVAHPTLKAWLANHPLCNDHTNYEIGFDHMNVVWDPLSVEVHSDTSRVGFLCGTYLMGQFKVSDSVDREELIDALLSMGAKVKWVK